MTNEGLSCTMYCHSRLQRYLVMSPVVSGQRNLQREMESSAVDHLSSRSIEIFLEGSMHAQEDDGKLSTQR